MSSEISFRFEAGKTYAGAGRHKGEAVKIARRTAKCVFFADGKKRRIKCTYHYENGKAIFSECVEDDCGLFICIASDVIE